MEALAAHLKRKNFKLLEEELSLPKIPQAASNQFTKTSLRIKKIKPPIKYVSETTFSPEEEHVHDQLRMVLHKGEVSPVGQNSRILQLLKGRQPIPEKKILPKVKQNRVSSGHYVHNNKREDRKASRQGLSSHRCYSVNTTKINLDSILNDQNEFIKNYFAEISQRCRR